MRTTDSQRVLKADTVRDLGTQIAYNYEDFRRRSAEYLESVRRKAQQTIEQARAEAVQVRQKAFDDGRRAGYAQGMTRAGSEIASQAADEARRQVDAQIATALPALEAAIAAVDHERHRWLSQWESLAICLSVAVAEKLIRHELKVRPEAAVPMLAEALELAAGSQHIKLKMHPLDIEQLGEHADDAVRRMASCGQVELVGDEAIAPGGCLVETQHGTIDARLETRLERIASELLQQDTDAPN